MENWVVHYQFTCSYIDYTGDKVTNAVEMTTSVFCEEAEIKDKVKGIVELDLSGLEDLEILDIEVLNYRKSK